MSEFVLIGVESCD